MKLNTNEQIRVDVMVKYINGSIRIEDATNSLQISERHFRRLLKKFREDGFESLKHGNIRRRPHNKTSDGARNAIIKLYKYKYFDFNVEHFREMLLKEDGYTTLYSVPSYQTIRRILLSENVIKSNSQTKRRAFKPRKKYTKEGLMVQIDGSHHPWIYGQKPFCLTAAIDDATGKILGAKFTPTETTFAAMDVVKDIVVSKGCFQMLYSDKAGIYGGGKRVGYTNMDRAMRALGIISVQANTPQAKGKVERLFKTLQDRLVSDMRIRGIESMDEANKFLKEEYIDFFNEKFAIKVDEQVYKNLNENIDLKEVFCLMDQRVIGNGNVFSFNSKRYYVDVDYCLYKRPVEIRMYPDGSTNYFVAGDIVKCVAYEEQNLAA